MKVIGRKKVSFKAKENNQQIEGLSLFCAYPITKDGDGVGVEKIFLSANKLSQLDFMPELDDEINVQYNRFGKVDTIIQIPV